MCASLQFLGARLNNTPSTRPPSGPPRFAAVTHVHLVTESLDSARPGARAPPPGHKPGGGESGGGGGSRGRGRGRKRPKEMPRRDAVLRAAEFDRLYQGVKGVEAREEGDEGSQEGDWEERPALPSPPTLNPVPSPTRLPVPSPTGPPTFVPVPRPTPQPTTKWPDALLWAAHGPPDTPSEGTARARDLPGVKEAGRTSSRGSVDATEASSGSADSSAASVAGNGSTFGSSYPPPFPGPTLGTAGELRLWRLAAGTRWGRGHGRLEKNKHDRRRLRSTSSESNLDGRYQHRFELIEHVDGDPLEAMAHLVAADVLVVGNSGFGHTAALYSRGIILRVSRFG